MFCVGLVDILGDRLESSCLFSLLDERVLLLLIRQLFTRGSIAKAA